MAIDRGKWTVQQGEEDAPMKYTLVRILSDDFAHDASLLITGDFESLTEKLEYAHDLAKRLNESKT